MGKVLKLQKPRQKGFRGHVREAVTDALDSAGEPIAAVIVTLGRNGSYALRSVNDENEIGDFDMYARASTLLNRETQELID